MNPTDLESLAKLVEVLLGEDEGAECQLPGEALHALEMVPPSEIQTIFAKLSDESLVRAIQKKCFVAEAFEELLVRRYGNQLRHWCRIRGVGAVDTDDLVASIVLRLWESRLRNFPPREVSFRAYLRATAFIYCYSVRRARRRQVLLDRTTEQLARCHTPEEAAIAGEEEKLLLLAIQRLPARMRDILHARLAGKSIKEIADAMGVTQNTVSGFLYRALRNLERHLQAPSTLVKGGREPTGRLQLERPSALDTPMHDWRGLLNDASRVSVREEADESVQHLYHRLGLTNTPSSSPSRINWGEFEQLFFTSGGWDSPGSPLQDEERSDRMM